MKISPVSMAVALTVPLFTSCNFLVSAIPLPGDRHLKNAPVSGRFSNEVTLIAVAPHTFLFVQPEKPEKRFSFTTHTDEYEPTTGRYRRRSWRIEPETMLTSGSSVPRLLWGVDGLGPMDFTKSAIVHDWLFEAHHRWQIAASAHEVETMETYKDYAAVASNTSTLELTMDDAADIMVEALKKEMRYNENCIQSLDQALDSPEVLNHSANAAAGLRELKKSFSIGRENPRKVKEYSFAIRTPFARRVWNPRGKKENIKQSPHNSTVEVIRILARNGSLDRAVEVGTITEDTAKKLRSLVKEKDLRDAKTERAENKKAKLEPAAAQPPAPPALLKTLGIPSPQAKGISIGAVCLVQCW